MATGWVHKPATVAKMINKRGYDTLRFPSKMCCISDFKAKSAQLQPKQAPQFSLLQSKQKLLRYGFYISPINFLENYGFK
eukprot:6458515-Amphidinium_carterae.1